MNAPVAPSPGKDPWRGGIGLSIGALGTGGIAGAEAETGVTTGVGVGATKTGSGKGLTFIGGTEAAGGGDGGMTAPGTGGAELNIG
jgi:hypothetical protein